MKEIRIIKKIGMFLFFPVLHLIYFHYSLLWILLRSTSASKELQRFNGQLFHPSLTKLFKLLRRTHPSDINTQTTKILNDISQRCDPCQRLRGETWRFRASVGSCSERINERIVIDITREKAKNEIIHAIDEGMKFSTAFTQ